MSTITGFLNTLSVCIWSQIDYYLLFSLFECWQMSISDQWTFMHTKTTLFGIWDSPEACYAVNVNEKSRSVSVWQMLLPSDPCNLIKTVNRFTLLWSVSESVVLKVDGKRLLCWLMCLMSLAHIGGSSLRHHGSWHKLVYSLTRCL